MRWWHKARLLRLLPDRLRPTDTSIPLPQGYPLEDVSRTGRRHSHLRARGTLASGRAFGTLVMTSQSSYGELACEPRCCECSWSWS